MNGQLRRLERLRSLEQGSLERIMNEKYLHVQRGKRRRRELGVCLYGSLALSFLLSDRDSQ